MEIITAGHSRQCVNHMHSNQDTIGSITVINGEGNRITLAIIADGVSLGYEGKYASYNTVLWTLQWASQYLATNPFDEQKIAGELQKRMKTFNHQLNEFSDAHSDKDTCCTVCGLVTDGKSILVFNAGDSRLYEVGADLRPMCLTNDDKAEDGYSIAMHIGGKNDDEISLTFSKTEFRSASQYILCTDGFYKRCNFSVLRQMTENMKSREEIEQLLSGVVDDLVAAGEADDISALLVAKIG